MVMQVLVLAVQNAVAYEILGSATSGVTLLRGIGGSLGTAVFGAIFTTRLLGELTGALACRGPLAASRPGGGAADRRPGRGAAAAGARRLRARLRRTRCGPSSSSPPASRSRASR